MNLVEVTSPRTNAARPRRSSESFSSSPCGDRVAAAGTPSAPAGPAPLAAAQLAWTPGVFPAGISLGEGGAGPAASHPSVTSARPPGRDGVWGGASDLEIRPGNVVSVVRLGS